MRLFRVPQSMDCKEPLGILIVKVLATATTIYAYLTTGVAPTPLVSILPYVVKPMYHLPMRSYSLDMHAGQECTPRHLAQRLSRLRSCRIQWLVSHSTSGLLHSLPAEAGKPPYWSVNDLWVLYLSFSIKTIEVYKQVT